MKDPMGCAARRTALTIEVRLSHDARRGGVAPTETRQFLREQLGALDEEDRRGVVSSFERNVAAKDPRHFETVYGMAGPVLLDLLNRVVRESQGSAAAGGPPAPRSLEASGTREVVAAANFALGRIHSLPSEQLRPEDAIVEFVLADRGKTELRVEPRLIVDKAEVKAAAMRILEDARRAPANLEIVRRAGRPPATRRRSRPSGVGSARGSGAWALARGARL